MKFKLGDIVKYKQGQAHYKVIEIDQARTNVKLQMVDSSSIYWANEKALILAPKEEAKVIHFDRKDRRHEMTVREILKTAYISTKERIINKIMTDLQGHPLYGKKGEIVPSFKQNVLDGYKYFLNQEEQRAVKKAFMFGADYGMGESRLAKLGPGLVEYRQNEAASTDMVDAMAYLAQKISRDMDKDILGMVDSNKVINKFNSFYGGVKEIKMQKTINKLNGLKLGEEQIVELTQEVAQKESFSISLFSLLKGNKLVAEMGFGKDALLQHLELHGENLVFKLTKGKVEKEENLASVQNLIKKM